MQHLGRAERAVAEERTNYVASLQAHLIVATGPRFGIQRNQDV